MEVNKISKSLIIYYSLQGHTKRVAEMTANKMGADILQLELEEDYNLATVLDISKEHIESKHTPQLKHFELDLEEYDQIYLGTPVWWFTFTSPLRSFLQKYSMKGKTVRFFCTHAGSIGSTFSDLEKLVVDADVLKPGGFYTYQDFDWETIENKVDEWLEG